VCAQQNFLREVLDLVATACKATLPNPLDRGDFVQ